MCFRAAGTVALKEWTSTFSFPDDLHLWYVQLFVGGRGAVGWRALKTGGVQ